MLYTVLWNLGTKATVTTELGWLEKISTLYMSLKFLLCAKASEKFSISKLKERLKFSLHHVLSSSPGEVAARSLCSQALEVLGEQGWLGVHRWDGASK